MPRLDEAALPTHLFVVRCCSAGGQERTEPTDQLRWPQVLEGMRALEKLLKAPLMRERFQCCCFDKADAAAKVFDNWSLSLVSLRWESVTAFSEGLLQVEFLLRKHWDTKKFLDGARDPASASGSRFQPRSLDKSEYSANVLGIQQAIVSKSFWAGVAIVHDISYQAEYVGRWAESCPCCQAESKSKPKPKQACPFEGCRASELATGTWQSALDKVMSASRSRLTEVLLQGSSADRFSYMSDWHTARGKLWSQLRVKLAHWNQLPWRLCVLFASSESHH